MEIDFDPSKNARNSARHGVSLDRFRDLDFNTAAIRLDHRRDYGEDRYIVTAYLGARLRATAHSESSSCEKPISGRSGDQKS